MASKKSCAQEAKQSEGGIFSAVLSGMASVFNQAVKTPRRRFMKPKAMTAAEYASLNENLAENQMNLSSEDMEGETSQMSADNNDSNEDIVTTNDDKAEETNSINDSIEQTQDSQVDASSQDLIITEKTENSTLEEEKLNENTSVSESIQTDLTVASLDTPLEDKSADGVEQEIKEKTHKRHSPKKKSRKKTKKDEDKIVTDLDEAVDPIKIDSPVPTEEVQVKPRIVLTFRSEKTGPRGTNVKIVTGSGKMAEKGSVVNQSGRRSLRNSKVSVVNTKTSPEPADLEQTESAVAHGNNSESEDGLKTTPKKNKRSNVSSVSDSNSDDSPSSHKDGVKRSVRHRSKEHSDNILANAMARKEKSINETLTAGTRLSRRIKPTAKVLANRELRIGFETQNNARLALVSDVNSPTEETSKISPKSKGKKTPEKGRISIMSSAKSATQSKSVKKIDQYEFTEEFDDSVINKNSDNDKPTTNEINRCILGEDDDGANKSVKDDDDQDSVGSKSDQANSSLSPEEVEHKRVDRLKKKHLKKLGLKEVSEKLKKKILPNREVVSDESTMDSTNTEAIVEHLNTRSHSFDLGSVGQPASPETARLLETIALFEEEDENTKAKESSDEEYTPYENERLLKKSKKRKASSSDLEDSLPIVQLSRLSEKTIKSKVRASRKKSKREPCEVEFVECADAPMDDDDPAPSSSEEELNEGEDDEEVEEAPEAVTEGIKGCFSGCLCTEHTNFYLHPNSVNETEFCRAVDWINGRAVGCSRVADTGLPLVRTSLRAPYFLPCNMHRRRLFSHHCCSACGAFCTQGIFYQCSEGHLFHWECGLPFVSLLMPSVLADVQNLTPHSTNNTTLTTNNVSATAKPVESGENATSTPVVNGEAIVTPAVTPVLISPPPVPTTPKLSASDIYNAVPGCPHCGLNDETLEPVNVDCYKVLIEMKTSGNKMILPNPRAQWVPSRMMFRQSGNEKQLKNDVIEDIEALVNEVDQDVAVIPPELLPGLMDGLVVLKERLERSETVAADGNGNAGANKDLIKAICDKVGGVEKIVAALVDGADPRKSLTEADGGSCLHLASREFNLSALHLCRTVGCHPNGVDTKRRTPLMVAIISYDNRIKKIEKDCEFTGVGGVSKEPKGDKEEREGRMEDLKKASRSELYNVIRYLVKSGCDPTIKGPEGVTALHLAAKNCDVGACALMLEGHLGVCRRLLNQKDAGGWTPLVWAAENNNVHVVRYLLEKGADFMIADTEKNIALHWAAVSGCSRSLEALLNAGCPVDVTNIHGDTPLHVSARQDNYNCLVVLLARAAKLDAKNANGEIPMDCADEESNCYSVLAVNNHLGPLVTALCKNETIVSSDISNGKELNVIQCINGVDDNTEWNHFTYVTENCYPGDVHIDRKMTSIEPCTCTGRCGQADSDCSCASISVQSWYEPSGKLVPHFDYDVPPMIFECNDMCSCNKNICLNRSLSRGPHCVLEVFRCGKPPKDCLSMGWGVRACTYIQRGQLVSEYIGEMLTTKEAYVREDHSYLFQLDSKHATAEEDKETYCIDARHYGNVSRFINHSCRPNLVPVRVFTSHRDLSFPRIAFFACRNVKSGEEITFDYGEHFWAAKSSSLKCQCRSDNCRYGDRQKKPFKELDTYDNPMKGDNDDDDDSIQADISDCDDVDLSMVKTEDISMDLDGDL